MPYGSIFMQSASAAAPRESSASPNRSGSRTVCGSFVIFTAAQTRSRLSARQKTITASSRACAGSTTSPAEKTGSSCRKAASADQRHARLPGFRLREGPVDPQVRRAEPVAQDAVAGRIAKLMAAIQIRHASAGKVERQRAFHQKRGSISSSASFTGVR